ncbi:hypothetical protein Poly51_15070 [Rubripirellula tenax]|uniref:Uncharacterized protein n=1 Tax=Rubripirellula tenax TaxID=2528015 RepID=A0A5C6FDJ4_9BACT|nr:hypothetical protein [Rubripirellula tenax]TWU58727.1 hypothetical protein Poly51_15070 [Rubripirellula tenax]
MTTSSDNTADPLPNPDSKLALAGEHWYEMTATLAPEATQAFAAWMGEDIDRLTEELSHFASARSVLKSIHR